MYILVMELPNFNKKNNSSTYDNEIKNINNIETSKNNENPIIISPKKSKESRMTIKPSMIHQEGSFTTKVDHLFESVKEKTSDYFDRVKIKQYDINSFAAATTGTATTLQESNKVPNQQEFIIPVLEEKATFSKNTVLEDIKIEKKWITHNEKIQVPVSYEKLFVNEKELDSFSNENIFTHIKDKILDFVYVEGNSNENKVEDELDEEALHTEQKSMDKNQYHTKNKKEIHQVMDERVPLFDERKDNLINEKDNNTVEDDNNKKVIPLYAEEIIVTKRKVKVGEIIVTKRKVNEVKKIELDIVKEKVTVDYANGRKENIT
jgi:stress response protein YsnF